MSSLPKLPLNFGQRLSTAVIGGLVGSGILILTYYLTGWMAGSLLSLLLFYEGWTLVNDHLGDTLSETLWRLARRPLIPLLFGIATGWAIASGWIRDPWLAMSVGILWGHFFWQAQGVYDGLGG